MSDFEGVGKSPGRAPHGTLADRWGKPSRPSGAGRDQLSDQCIGIADILALPVWQRLFCAAMGPLVFITKDCRRTHQREIARSDGVAHQAMIFPLGVVTAIVLFGFDGPVSALSITNALAASSPRRNEGQRGRDPSPSMAQVIAKKESAHPGKLLIFTRGTAHTGTPFFPWPLEG